MKSSRVALCGMIGALSSAIMFFGGIFPFSYFVMPAIAGTVFIPIVIETGRRWALMTYTTVSLVSAIIVFDKFPVLIFIMFFGFYPILKSFIEGIKEIITVYAIKFALFNTVVFLCYYTVTSVIVVSEIADELAEYNRVLLMAFLVLANVAFLMYDMALTSIVSIYLYRFSGIVRRLMRLQ
ncbi:MAG: hypothetical protein FWH14_00440 [Oscillospiraceae bacterium]|nr:hypothetical protein [Oscillospiraceae bacterium]